MRSAIENHEQRIAWQLHRIYRARNNIVHAGRVPTFLDSIVLNIDEYYRAALGTIVNRASREAGLTDIDQLVFEIGAEYRVHRRCLDELGKQKSFTAEDLKNVFL